MPAPEAAPDSGPGTARTTGGTRNRAILVVGAGRSGTSAVTRGLAALGVELGDHLKPATAKNPTGFFEDEDLLRVGKQARASLGLSAESVALIDDDAWSRPRLEELRREAVETIERRFGNAPVWCFKYAQTLRLLPFWLEVLESARVDSSWVVAARNPLSVARSRAKLDPLRGVQEKSDAEWLVNVVPYFRQLAVQPFVVVDFDLLMEDPSRQLRRLAAALELPLDAAARGRIEAFADSFLLGGMRHTVFDDGDLEKTPGVNPLTRDAYRWLRKLATDEISTDDIRLRHDWARIERDLALQAPTLRYVDQVVAELRRAERRGLRGLRVRLLKRLKRVRWIAAAYGALKLRRDSARSAGAGASAPRP
jgi:hypothetical protein